MQGPKPKLTMSTFKILEKANEYRIQIIGRFAGASVRDVETSWRAALQANLQRQLVVDISRLDGYDSSGQSLLREMHKHGTLIAASTSVSLVYLQEVTSVERGPAPATIPAKKPQARRISSISVAAANN